jgi:Transposase zinc-ribbon domain
MFILSQRYFWDEEAAHAKLEEIVWPKGPVCVRCGASDRIGAVTGKGARAGLKFCCRCRKQFRATIGTIFEGSHVPLHKWFQACFILSAAQTSVTAYKLHLHLEVTNKTALCMLRRLRGRILSARQKSRFAASDRSAQLRSHAGVDPPPSRGDIHVPSAKPSTGPSSGSLARAPGGGGPGELAATRSMVRPRRQFLHFVESANGLGCVDNGEFDRLLAELDLQFGRRSRLPLGPRSAEATAAGIAEPDIRVRAAA